MRKVTLENARTIVNQADATARDTLQRVTDLIAQYRAVEGRKTVILFSEGFHQANVARELEQVAAAAAQSYAVFYSFDLNRRAGTDIADPLTPSMSAASEIQARTEPLGNLAVETDCIASPTRRRTTTSSASRRASRRCPHAASTAASLCG
jgi:hypothetical protein